MAQKKKKAQANGRKNKPRPRRTRARRNGGLKQATCKLSPIACAYSETLAKPEIGPLVGIPNGDTIYSKKFRVWKRGVVNGGTGVDPLTNNLAILCQPFAALTNDCNVLAYTAGGATPTPLPADLATNGQVSNAPYAAANFGTTATTVQGRLVSAKLRVRFAGTKLNTGGLFYGLQEATHGNIAGSTADQLMARTSCLHEPIQDGNWFEVHYRPVDGHDTWWIDTVSRSTASNYNMLSDAVAVASSAGCFMGIICNVAAASQPIEYEFWAVVEYAGSTVTGKTLTPPDLQGWASVIAANSQIEEHSVSQPMHPTTDISNQFASSLRNVADNLLSAAAPYATQAATAAGAALFRRFAPRIQSMPRVELID